MPASPFKDRCLAPILLPPQQGDPRKTLVLDLDRTLIDCIPIREVSPFSDPDFLYTDELGTQAKVWIRPFLRQFLSAAARDFEVVLFTAAGARHADSVLKVLDPKQTIFSHRLYGQHTTEVLQWSWVKDLSRLGRPLHSTLLVDDSLLAGLLQPCSLVPIKPFVHNNPRKDRDTALPELLRFLQDKVLPAHDVRQAVALHWNKISRRPRRRALQPRPQPPPAPIAFVPCQPCCCHATRQPHEPCTCSASKAQTVHIGGTDLPRQANMSSHVHGKADVAWQQCAAAEQGCGCRFGTEDHALVAAAAAYDMNATHGTSDEEDDADHDIAAGAAADGGGDAGDAPRRRPLGPWVHATAPAGLQRSRRGLGPLTDSDACPPIPQPSALTMSLAAAAGAVPLQLAPVATGVPAGAAATGAGGADAMATAVAPSPRRGVSQGNKQALAQALDTLTERCVTWVLGHEDPSLDSPIEPTESAMPQPVVLTTAELCSGTEVACRAQQGLGSKGLGQETPGTRTSSEALDSWPTNSSHALSIPRSSLDSEGLTVEVDGTGTPMAPQAATTALVEPSPTAHAAARESVLGGLNEVGVGSLARVSRQGSEGGDERGSEGRVRAGRPKLGALCAARMTT